jgi:hypothetical protein
MTIAEAVSSFIRFANERAPVVRGSHDSASQAHLLAESLEPLIKYFSRTDRLEDLTPERLRDFLARYCIGEASAGTAPRLQILFDSISQFLMWTARYSQSMNCTECLAVIRELEQSIPRALQITEMLSKHIAERGGAFTFPEFLTSFEGGGQSQYDLDAPGDVGAIEGYFRITRVNAVAVEAIETISEESVGPIIFPESVASLLSPEFILNLELVRDTQGWQIVACGFAYPPGTSF